MTEATATREGEVGLADLIEAAAHVLCMRGYLDPEAEEWPDDLVAELVEVWHKGPCEVCPAWGGPHALADHFLSRKQREYEQSLPVWTCDCGAVYKELSEFFDQPGFWELCDDGLLGERIGGVRVNAKGHVKHSDKCPACGRSFADTIDRRTNPQQSLF